MPIDELHPELHPGYLGTANLSTASAAAPLTAWEGPRARILIVDGHPISRAGLRALLQTAQGFHVVGEAAQGETALRLVRELRPDLVLIDCSASFEEGMNMLARLHDEASPVRTLLLSSVVDHKDILKAMQSGACGVMMKNSTAAMLFEGIRTVVDGRFWIGQQGVTSLVHALRDRITPEPRPEPVNRFSLTPREIEIVQTVVRGYSNQDIATRFNLSLNTVKHHITHVFNKLNVSNRLELALFAINNHLVDDSLESASAAKRPAVPAEPAAQHVFPRQA